MNYVKAGSIDIKVEVEEQVIVKVAVSILLVPPLPGRVTKGTNLKTPTVVRSNPNLNSSLAMCEYLSTAVCWTETSD